MRFVRRHLLMFVFLAGLLPGAWATSTTTSSPATATDVGPLVIVLEHQWVVELFGQRFGLIQFDTPMTTILLGGVDFDIPARASAVLLPLLALPLLAAVGFGWHQRRCRGEDAAPASA